MARDFDAVMGDMIGACEDDVLKARLEKVKADAWFRAPEERVLDWQAAQDVLEDHFDTPRHPAEEWMHTLVDIWTAEKGLSR